MNPNFRKLTATAALAIGMAGGGAMVANAATGTDSATKVSTATAVTATTQTQDNTPPQDCGHNGGPGGQDHAARDAALAKALGVTTGQLTAARDAARAAVEAKYGKPDHTKPPTAATRTAAQTADMKARRELFDKTMADKLGISVEKLHTAMVTVEKAHLEAEVKAGHLTQAQADAILKAIQNGERPPFGAGHGGPGHGGWGHGGPGQGGPAAGTPAQ